MRQTVQEYMDIINNTVFKEFGTYLPFGKKFTEQLKFSFDDENMTIDDRKKLAMVAAKRVSDKRNLPKGVRLTGCTILLGGGEI